MMPEREPGPDWRRGRRRRFNRRWAREHVLGGGPAYVYVLVDSETRQVGYVGVTWDPTSRFEQHRRDVLRDRSPRGDWLRALAEQGRKAEPVIVACCPTRSAAELLERALIQRYQLTNTLHRWKGKEHHDTWQLRFLAPDGSDDGLPY